MWPMNEECGTSTWINASSSHAAYLVGTRKPYTDENAGEL